MIVRAKLKSIESLPDWALCCDPIRSAHMRSTDEILKIDLEKADVLDAKCSFCGKVCIDVKVVMVCGENKVILIDLYDLDEGEVE